MPCDLRILQVLGFLPGGRCRGLLIDLRQVLHIELRLPDNLGVRTGLQQAGATSTPSPPG